MMDERTQAILDELVADGYFSWYVEDLDNLSTHDPDDDVDPFAIETWNERW